MTAQAQTDQNAPATGTQFSLMVLVVIWGVNFPIIKVALEQVPPLGFNALRFPMASLSIGALLLLAGKMGLPDRKDALRVIALGILGNVGYQYFFIMGVAGTTAGNASVILATVPAWTAILSTAVGHEKLPGKVWLGVAGAMVGMLLVVTGGQGLAFSFATLRGDLLMVGAALTWTVYTVGAKTMIGRYGAMRVTAWTLWVGTLGIVPMGLPSLRTVDLGDLTFGAWIAVIYAGVFAISIAYALWNRGVNRIGNSRTAIYQNAVPVVAIVTAWITLGERPGPLQSTGALLILSSVSLARRPKERSAPDR